MAKPLDDLNAGKGMLLPAPIVTPGTVPGAGVFDGRLQARGLLLGSPQSSTQGITTDRLDWVRDTTGVLYAMITQYRSTVASPALSLLGIQAQGDGSEFPAAELALSAVSNTDGAFLQLNANETPSASVVAKTLGGNQAIILASDKSSDFVQKQAARIYRSTDQTITTATLTAITFDTVRYDVFGSNGSAAWDGANPTRLTCRVAGYYRFNGHVRWAANVTGRRVAQLRINGAVPVIANDQRMAVTDAGISTGQIVSGSYQMAVGDYVELVVLQASGGNLAASMVANDSVEMSMERIA